MITPSGLAAPHKFRRRSCPCSGRPAVGESCLAGWGRPSAKMERSRSPSGRARRACRTISLGRHLAGGLTSDRFLSAVLGRTGMRGNVRQADDIIKLDQDELLTLVRRHFQCGSTAAAGRPSQQLRYNTREGYRVLPHARRHRYRAGTRLRLPLSAAPVHPRNKANELARVMPTVLLAQCQTLDVGGELWP